MFIRETKKQRSKTSNIFYQYALVKSTRIDGKSRQQTILYLGSDKELRDKINRKLVLDVLKEKILGTPSMFSDIPDPLYRLAMKYYEKYRIKYADMDESPVSKPPDEDRADYETIDLHSVGNKPCQVLRTGTPVFANIGKTTTRRLFKIIGSKR